MNDRKKKDGGADRASGAADAAPGVPFDPASLDDDTGPEGEGDAPRAAPAPQSPLSDDELQRLKSEAVTSKLPPTTHGRPDPAAKKQGG